MTTDDRPRGPLHTKTEARKYLRIGKTTFNAKVARGEIARPDVILGPKLERYSQGLLDDIVARHAVLSEGK
jgi:hypothetical protein